MRILGIETSCDDTSVAIYDAELGLIFHSTLNQNHVHAKFNGIVPELAARSHLYKLIYLIKKVCIKYLFDNKYNIKKNTINAIAYTSGPGLVGSLLVGATIARTLSLSLNIPCILVNHLEGHLLSVMLNNKKNLFPFLALLVSGANTQLISTHCFGKYTVLGKTMDDSVGHVFDYIAKLLGLGYPGGKKLSNLAKHGQSGKYFFPRPMINNSNLNFSFSGLKTHVKNVILECSDLFNEKYNIACSFEEAVVDTLIIKCQLAIQRNNLKNFLVCGGFSANDLLRKKLKNLFKDSKTKIFFSKKIFCTDNAAMIAYVGLLKYNLGLYSQDQSITVYPNLLINENID
ncbi:tRNA (adenosine(37)-N6)-threonylcarbamoyltransferase complex transferase subunit TsaD [Buchnera aphidicola]|uniref:tRNA N6-adenosine threonylcarbamoyltransferase n=1 Tax=Buchnera aphidicola (Cinara laricifoliae) TaxID=2518977 RepID=A0A451DAW1_9GAMM|nr:tRNA (adenosine(37)-N6)-threonylcarbamoyltransferase complex transferase subunit TsaD [Buchnera aphidicola]VFP83507.1 tRNA N6-adenosine threonylcarbamoyltransferase [Buchnera aphidicola (Cinara laricifoliae)]